MYEKTMYKVQGRDNKVIFRLQDFTKNDNVDESVFVEGTNSKGAKRLQCQVLVLHQNEYKAIIDEHEQTKQHVEELNNKIMQKDVEIKKLEGEIAKLKRANVDERKQLRDEKFNMVQEHERETRRLEKQHQNELDGLKETHENQLHAIDESHKENIKKLRAHYTRKLDDANEQLLNTVKENNTESDKLRGEMVNIKDDHKKEIITLQHEHHKEVEKLQHERSDELQALQKQHTYDIDQLKQTLADNKQEHLIEVNEIREQHHVEFEDMRTRFIKLLATEHAQDLSELNECGEPPRVLRLFARGFVESFNEFKKRKEMNTPQKIVETYELKRGEDDEMSP